MIVPKIGARKSTTKTEMLVDATPKRRRLYVQNLGTASVELLSSKDGRYGEGIRIAPSGDHVIRDVQGAYWHVAESGSQDLRFEEDIEV